MLSFQDDVRFVFRFLETDFGFSIHVATPTRVHYQSSTTWVSVDREGGYGEVTVSLSLIAFDRPGWGGYSLQSVLQALGVPSRGRYPDLYAYTPDVRHRVLERLAGWLQQAKPALVGDRAAWLRVSDADAREMDRSTRRDKTAAWARQHIRDAWEQGDYATVARMYAHIDKAFLTEEERSQRALARRIFIEGDAADPDTLSRDEIRGS